uniref:NADH-ubiquinone oxidoreductase chain 2 n=1 Tax=Metaperipatus inae TaxID=444703 RepID=B3F5K5_9BILA|nr:NADH dehydrogenase subunit 2 [Metaperipatus inae]ABQ95563.1 NADH dehydrogenase subunit 2 [Metaperipatus inae]
MLFLSIIFLTVIFQISSLSWFSIWIAMELNLLSFIPLLSTPYNILYNEGSMKYFLIQVFGSIILLMGWLSGSLMFFNVMYGDEFSNLLFYVSLILKMGAAPFHFWFPLVLESLSWMNSFLMMTWQKLGPLMLLSFINKLMFLLMMSSIFSSLIGGFGGFNQVSFKKIFAYSSIGHLGWMLISLIMVESYFIMYYMFYILMVFMLCMVLFLKNLSSLNQFLFLSESFFLEKLFFLFSLLSLGGLPPFSGFFVKWMILNSILILKLKFLGLILIMSTLVSLFYYLRISYSVLLKFNLSLSFIMQNMKINNYFLMKIIILIMMVSLIMIPLMIWML